MSQILASIFNFFSDLLYTTPAPDPEVQPILQPNPSQIECMLAAFHHPRLVGLEAPMAYPQPLRRAGNGSWEYEMVGMVDEGMTETVGLLD